MQIHFDSIYKGKVRDCYQFGEQYLLIVVSDRISAFDHILPRNIPQKGAVLNLIAAHFLAATRDIVPNWLLATPEAHTAVGYQCEPIRVEMVVRGYLAGHALREYERGERMLCGVTLPEGMRPYERFAQPIITPSTKAIEGHDEDISREALLERGFVSEADYTQMEQYALALFERGTTMAAERGLILVDTKYEFGKRGGEVVLIDEIHTPDSSRYFEANTYPTHFEQGETPPQLSKEFVREWLMANGFQGKEGEMTPTMPDEFVTEISNRYIALYERITGKNFAAQVQQHATNNEVSPTEAYMRALLEKGKV